MNDRTPAQSDETRQQIGIYCSIYAEAREHEDVDTMRKSIDNIEELIAADRSRLLDAVEGVIGEDEKQPDNEPYMATRIDPYAYQRNKLRAELRAALKGLREGNDG